MIAAMLSKLWRKINNRRPSRLFFHILAYFLLMVLLTAATGIISSVVFYFQKQQEYQENARQSQRFAAELCTSYIKPAMELNFNTINHFLLKRYLVPFSTATIEQKLNLSLVPSIINSNKNLAGDVVDELFIYNSDDHVFTLNGVDDFSLYLNKYYAYRDIQTNYFAQQLGTSSTFHTLAPTKVHRFYQGESTTVLPIISTEYINGYNTVVVTNINLSKVTAILKNANRLGGTEFVVLDSENQLLTGSRDELTQDALPSILTSQAKLIDQGPRYLTIAGVSYYVSYLPLGDYGWQYYSLTPIRTLLWQGNYIIPTTLFTCIMLVVLGLILSFRFTGNIFNPIHNIRDLIEQNSDPDHSARQPLGQLIRSESNIDSLLDNYYDALHHKKISFDFTLLTALIENRIPFSQADFDSMLEKSCGFTAPYYCCNVIRFTFNDVFYEELDDEMQQTVCQALLLLINEYTKPLCGSYSFELGDGVFINLMNLEGDDQHEQISTCFEQLLQVLSHDDRYYKVCIGMGRIREGSRHIPDSYDDAMTAVDCLCCTTQLASAYTLEISHRIHYSLATEKKIISLFEKGELKSLRQTIEELVDEHTARNLSWRCMHELLKRIYYSASLQTSNAPHLFDEAQISCTLDEKVAMLLDAYEKIMAPGEQDDVKGEKLIISAIRQHIDQRFSEDVSLQAMADIVGYNYKYISRIFKEYTGYNISDYINIVRINKAKELIENTALTMEEIQNIVGIPSRSTFNRVFKKHEGIPPSQYRQLRTHNRILDSLITGEARKGAQPGG